MDMTLMSLNKTNMIGTMTRGNNRLRSDATKEDPYQNEPVTSEGDEEQLDELDELMQRKFTPQPQQNQESKDYSQMSSWGQIDFKALQAKKPRDDEVSMEMVMDTTLGRDLEYKPKFKAGINGNDDTLETNQSKLNTSQMHYYNTNTKSG